MVARTPAAYFRVCNVICGEPQPNLHLKDRQGAAGRLPSARIQRASYRAYRDSEAGVIKRAEYRAK